MTVRSPRRKAAATCTRMAGFTPFQAIAGDGGAAAAGGRTAAAAAGEADEAAAARGGVAAAPRVGELEGAARRRAARRSVSACRDDGFCRAGGRGGVAVAVAGAVDAAHGRMVES